MKELPNLLKLKLLEHNPTPTLEEMLAFVQRYRAVEGFASPAPGNDFSVASSSSTPAPDNAKLSELISMVAGIAEKQKTLEDRLINAESSQPTSRRRGRQTNSNACYTTVAKLAILLVVATNAVKPMDLRGLQLAHHVVNRDTSLVLVHFL